MPLLFLVQNGLSTSAKGPLCARNGHSPYLFYRTFNNHIFLIEFFGLSFFQSDFTNLKLF